MANEMLGNEMAAAKRAARQAGAAIMAIAEKHYQTAATQADRTVVTLADVEADRILQEHLRTGFPDYGWLSEETRDDASRLDRDRVWIVDPMDGTREFVMKVPDFVVSVALAEAGEPILAVIYNPTTGDLYEAIRGQGTQLNGTPVHCDHALADRPKVEVSRSDIEKGRFAGYEQYVDLHAVGSIAYKLARLAAGQADATLSITPKNEWDIAAGVLLAEEAGGKVTDLKGQRHQFNQQDTLLDGVIATTPAAYDVIRDAVASAAAASSQ